MAKSFDNRNDCSASKPFNCEYKGAKVLSALCILCISYPSRLLAHLDNHCVRKEEQNPPEGSRVTVSRPANISEKDSRGRSLPTIPAIRMYSYR